MRKSLPIIIALLIAATASAEDGDVPRRGQRYNGLSILVDAGGYWASNNTANFYSGREGNANTITRILHSDTYGRQIWENLKNQQLISSAIGNYTNLQIDEYPDMYYRLSYVVGLGLRYDYPSGLGWLLRVDLASLQAVGAFNLSSTNGTGILTDNNRYIRCGILGKESRINIDLALIYTIPLTERIDFEINLGAQLNNTKVDDNLIEIGGATYSILDVWGGRTPDYGVGDYTYINQGGIGWGTLASAFVGYQVPGIGTLKAGYTLYYAKTVLEGYTAIGYSHALTIRAEINNFSFFNK